MVNESSNIEKGPFYFENSPSPCNFLHSHTLCTNDTVLNDSSTYALSHVVFEC